MNNTDYKSINVSPISGALGAKITGVELKNSLQDSVLSEIYKAFLEYKVIFFNDQELLQKLNLGLVGCLDNLSFIHLSKALKIFLK